jgi:hypothetical protein
MKMTWMGRVARIEVRSAYPMLESLEGKKPFERPNRRWEDNIRTHLGKLLWEVVDFIRLVQDRDQCDVVNTVMNFRVA